MALNSTKILVDCTNTYSGGAKTHLRELSSRISSEAEDIVYTFVGAEAIMGILPDVSCAVEKRTHSLLNRGTLARYFWRVFFLPRLVREFDLVFFPGGTIVGKPTRSVTMSRNMLPLMREEYLRYGLSKYYFKVEFLRMIQRRSFRRATGIIFLSEFAREMVFKELGVQDGNIDSFHRLIPHGIADEFRDVHRSRNYRFPGRDEKLSLLYVSSFDVYKNQETVLLAVKRLRDDGRDVEVRFVGPRNPTAYRRFRRLRNRIDPSGEWSKVESEIGRHDLCARYAMSDIFIYASTCENLPNILLEAMAAGIPIVCSDSRPMSDILGEGGTYFEARSPVRLAAAILETAESEKLREAVVERAQASARSYDWDMCARETLDFLGQIVQKDIN